MFFPVICVISCHTIRAVWSDGYGSGGNHHAVQPPASEAEVIRPQNFPDLISDVTYREESAVPQSAFPYQPGKRDPQPGRF